MKESILKLLRSLPESTPESTQYISENFEDFEYELESIYARLLDVVEEAQDVVTAQEQYRKDLEKHSISLDKDNRIMFFDGQQYPAYWYKKGMSQEEIDEKLDMYKEILHDNPKARYPLLEIHHSLKDWKDEIQFHLRGTENERLLEKMEKDLESREGEDAQKLYDLLYSDCSFYELFDKYPRKLKKIVKVISTGEENGLKIATLVLKTTDGKQCTVEVEFTPNGTFRGMKAIGRNGFPLFVEDDYSQIWQEVF